MKVSIIGAAGLVGSCTAFALQTGRIVRDIALLDANAEGAAGQALDLAHGSPLVADQVIHAGGYEQIPDSDLICITAGLRRKPDESRLDLINRNVDLFLSILDEMRRVGYRRDAIVLVVSNPVDVLTYLAADRLDLPLSQVLGLGTQLDTIRFRSLIATALHAAPTQVSAVILGEHGDSMVPIWSCATAAGLPLDKYPGWTPHLANELFTPHPRLGRRSDQEERGRRLRRRHRHSGSHRIDRADRHRMLPVSSVQQGCYGIRDVALSVPTVVGRAGVVDRVEIELWPKEVQALRKSGQVLRETVDTVLARVGAVANIKSLSSPGEAGCGARTRKQRTSSPRKTTCKNRSIGSWPPFTPTRRAARASSLPTPRTPTWLSASAAPGNRPKCTPAKSASARWPNIASRCGRSSGKGTSTSCSCRPAATICSRFKKGLFENSHVTPAARANDTTDIFVLRGGQYIQEPSRPFRTAAIDHIQCGHVECAPTANGVRGAISACTASRSTIDSTKTWPRSKSIAAFDSRPKRRAFAISSKCSTRTRRSGSTPRICRTSSTTRSPARWPAWPRPDGRCS